MKREMINIELQDIARGKRWKIVGTWPWGNR